MGAGSGGNREATVILSSRLESFSRGLATSPALAPEVRPELRSRVHDTVVREANRNTFAYNAIVETPCSLVRALPAVPDGLGRKPSDKHRIPAPFTSGPRFPVPNTRHSRDGVVRCYI